LPREVQDISRRKPLSPGFGANLDAWQKELSMKKLIPLFFVLLAIPGMAQPQPNSASFPLFHKSCSIAGTWYGGGDYKYIVVITPTVDWKYAIRGEGAYSNAAFGYTGWTAFMGEVVQTGARRFSVQEIAVLTTSDAIVPPEDSIELDVVHATFELTGCDTFTASYDLFGAYFDLAKTPFVDPVDLSYLPPEGIHETYRRMPDKCPICGPAYTVPHHTRQARPKENRDKQ
jgi:hypothetical protein